MDAVFTRLVRTRRNNAASFSSFGISPDNNRFPGKRRIITLFHSGKKSIEIHVDNNSHDALIIHLFRILFNGQGAHTGLGLQKSFPTRTIRA